MEVALKGGSFTTRCNEVSTGRPHKVNGKLATNLIRFQHRGNASYNFRRVLFRIARQRLEIYYRFKDWNYGIRWTYLGVSLDWGSANDTYTKSTTILKYTIWLGRQSQRNRNDPHLLKHVLVKCIDMLFVINSVDCLISYAVFYILTSRSVAAYRKVPVKTLDKPCLYIFLQNPSVGSFFFFFFFSKSFFGNSMLDLAIRGPRLTSSSYHCLLLEQNKIFTPLFIAEKIINNANYFNYNKSVKFVISVLQQCPLLHEIVNRAS